MRIGDWGLGIGDWGLGIGPNPQSTIPNPQYPIPMKLFIINYIKYYKIIYIFLKNNYKNNQTFFNKKNARSKYGYK